MIESMNKLFFVVRNEDMLDSLSKIQDLGLVHIEHGGVNSENLDDCLALKKRIDKFLKYFDPKLVKTNIQSIYRDDIRILLDDYEEKLLRLADLESQKLASDRNFSSLKVWGDFNIASKKELEESGGLVFNFFSLSQSSFDAALFDNYFYSIISENSTRVNIILICKNEEMGDIEKLDLERVILPSEQLSSCKLRIEKTFKDIIRLKEEISSLGEYYNYAAASEKILSDKISFNEIKLSMNNHHESFSSVMGWFPARNRKKIESVIDGLKNSLYWVDDKIKEEEIIEVPILLRNNWFNKLFEPITELFSLPAYAEIDLTPFFAPFFVMFFGLCLGDAGYGLIVFLATLIAYFKIPKMRPVLLLGMFLGLSTMLWGFLTGTTFGVNVFETNIPVLSKIATFKSGHMFYLALMIGLVQILFGIIVQTVNRFIQSGPLSALSPIGWMILIVVGTFGYLSGQPSEGDFKLGLALIEFSKSVPHSMVVSGAIIGVCLILFFNDMKVNIFVRFGKGLWELYGITGVFGDLLSYIRLFALGISSAILGSVINSIAKEFLNIPVPGLSHAIFVIFLVIGHTCNLGLAALGSFVHPLRLTFVEFYKNSGFTGGGVTYSPFKKQYIENLNNKKEI